MAVDVPKIQFFAYIIASIDLREKSKETKNVKNQIVYEKGSHINVSIFHGHRVTK